MKIVGPGSVAWELRQRLFWAINKLERLQRMRQGEAVPAPLSVEVSERG